MVEYNRTLGITIPTFRRPEWLRVSIASIIEAARPFNIPLFVVDDSADDTNVGVVSDLHRSYPHIFHFRNDQNLGIDRNIARSIQICECDYAWLLGEDDLLRRDSVEKVMHAVGGGQSPAFVAVNYTLLNEDYSAVLRERFVPIKRDESVKSDEFLRRWGWAIGFIGACVVNKDLWSRVEPARYFDTYWAHVGAIMESIFGLAVDVIADPLVLKRYGSPSVFSWSDSTFEVADGWERLLARLVPVYGEPTCREAIQSFEKVFGLHGRFLVYARGAGLYDVEGYRKRILGRGLCPISVAGAWMIARMPRGLAKSLVQASRQARTLRNRIRGTIRLTDLPTGIELNNVRE
jgi:abequosyltransferase